MMTALPSYGEPTMTKLMVDEKTAGKLKGFKDPVLLCDPTGHVIGRVIPPSLYDHVVVPFTEEELRQAEAETEEFTLAEMVAELEKQ
jgi:hypothetical protein